MNNKSSIEWLINQITEDQMVKAKSLNEWLEIFEQAKAMHKDEIEETFFQGAYGGDIINAEQYYNETFGGDNE